VGAEGVVHKGLRLNWRTISALPISALMSLLVAAESA
jgi:hypothetical protein